MRNVALHSYFILSISRSIYICVYPALLLIRSSSSVAFSKHISRVPTHHLNTMFYSIIRTAFVLTVAMGSSSVQARVQSGLCGDNGLDGITGTVPACMFEAGAAVSPNANTTTRMNHCWYLNLQDNGESSPYQLAISGITSVSHECTIQTSLIFNTDALLYDQCDQCTNGTVYGLYRCTLYDCAEDDPYEPCGYASC